MIGLLYCIYLFLKNMMGNRGAQEVYMAQRQNARPQYMQVW